MHEPAPALGLSVLRQALMASSTSKLLQPFPSILHATVSHFACRAPPPRRRKRKS